MTKLVLSKASQKFIKKINDKEFKNRIKVSLDKIMYDYTVGSRKKGDLKGLWSLDLFYNKTNYEICYQVIQKEDTTILIVMIGTRENFYKELKRYIKK
ncbi:type II toxin-antitoxin system RelE/ParE family toxin [Ezakiella peruensis]|uniref:type II toxin-antitoxin system RelE/ParE family toxin n=1 Tax=Ezakiella peruensis TaxID=1464038 RepID=UPI000C1B1EBB|nr:type II toxin-antitoxin system RelE/ParE family toxin [Ezakiella peruensis]